MKRKFVAFLLAASCTTLVFQACKKSNDDSKTDDTVTNAQVAAQADDEAMIASEMDNAASDVSAVIESDATFSGANAVVDRIVCDANVVIDRYADPMTMTITYDGSTCTTKKTRSGVVVVAMAKGTQWKTQGAQVTVSFQNLKITRSSDKKYIVLNGTHTITNTSGKLLSQLATSGTIIHTVTSSNMSITLEDGTARTWNVARQRTYTFDNGAVLAISGIHTEGNVKNIAEWGMNRFGKAFITTIDSAMVYKQSCNFRLTAGTVTHTTAAYTATATFGLNASGSVSGCPAEGSSYFYHLTCKLKTGAELSIVLPY